MVDRFSVFDGKNIDACINDCTLVEKKSKAERKRVQKWKCEWIESKIGERCAFLYCTARRRRQCDHIAFCSFSFEPSFQFIVITDMMMIKAWMAICYARTILTHTQLLTLFSSFVHFFWQLGKPLFLQFAIKKVENTFLWFSFSFCSCRVVCKNDFVISPLWLCSFLTLTFCYYNSYSHFLLFPTFIHFTQSIYFTMQIAY